MSAGFAQNDNSFRLVNNRLESTQNTLHTLQTDVKMGFQGKQQAIDKLQDTIDAKKLCQCYGPCAG